MTVRLGSCNPPGEDHRHLVSGRLRCQGDLWRVRLGSAPANFFGVPGESPTRTTLHQRPECPRNLARWLPVLCLGDRCSLKFIESITPPAAGVLLSPAKRCIKCLSFAPCSPSRCMTSIPRLICST